jgi:phage terminase large subunit
MNEWIPVIRAAKAAGCSEDQVENFIEGRVVLQPRQLLASAAARACDREGGPVEVGFGGARGGGKSFWVLAQTAVDDCQRWPGLKVLWLRKVGKANLEQLQDLRKHVLKSTDHEFVTHRGVMNFPNGSQIITGHFQNENDIDTYLGLEYDVIVVEEATTLSERKYRDIKTCNRSSKGWRPRMYLTTNPGGIGHAWFKKRFIIPLRKGEETETRFIQSLPTDNRFNNPEYINVLKNLRGWQHDAWFKGEWDLPLGQYFVNFREDVHVLKDIDDTLAREWFCGLDYGFTHYTCCYLGFQSHDGDWFVVNRHRARQWLPAQHAKAIREMIGQHRIEPPGYRERKLQLEDLQRISAGSDVFSRQPDGTTIADQYRKHGIKLTCAYVDRIQGWALIQELLGNPSEGIRPRLYIHACCAELIEGLPLLQHDAHRPEDVLKVDCDEEGNGGDDDADGFRYLVASKPKKVIMRKLRGF